MSCIDGIGRSLISKVKKWISSENLIFPGDLILCGLSGGSDSVAMLLILDALKDELGFSIRAAHVNHMLRGAEAERDAEFCRAFCEKRGIGFTLLRGDAAGLAKEKKLGLEEAARELRYGLLKSEISRLGFNKIATAHNADDNLETVLINLARGAALRGLSGIQPKNGEIIRPILPLTKRETKQAVSAFGETFVLDSSNETDFCRRNRIRHDIVPILYEFNPDISAAVLENGVILRKEDEYLLKTAEKALAGLDCENGLDIKKLSGLDEALLFRALRKAAENAGAELDRKKAFELAALLKTGGTTWLSDVGGGVVCERSYGFLHFEKKAKEEPFCYCFSLTDGLKRALPGGYVVSVRKTANGENIYRLFNNFRVNCDTIVGDLVVRTPRGDDRFRKNEKSGSKKLSRLFIDKKIPRKRRALVPVVADGRGVLWVYGIGANAEFRDYDENNESLTITIDESDENRVY